MRYRNPGMQIIGLWATIGNPGVLARWMDAELITSEWRPVDLRQGVFYNGSIRFHELCRPVETVSKYDDLNLCMDTIAEGGQCLVFVSSRKNAEAFAKRAASAFKLENSELKELSERINKLAETDNDKLLAACVESGAAFHHAGLKREARATIEEGFRKGLVLADPLGVAQPEAAIQPLRQRVLHREIAAREQLVRHLRQQEGDRVPIHPLPVRIPVAQDAHPAFRLDLV